MAKLVRNPNLFEKVLLIVGIALIVVGYISIHRMVVSDRAFSWDFLQTTFMWLIMILLIILAAVNENMKEELRTVIENQIEEMKLLRNDFRKKKK